jgi:hypothetical protein
VDALSSASQSTGWAVIGHAIVGSAGDRIGKPLVTRLSAHPATGYAIIRHAIVGPAGHRLGHAVLDHRQSSHRLTECRWLVGWSG